MFSRVRWQMSRYSWICGVHVASMGLWSSFQKRRLSAALADSLHICRHNLFVLRKGNGCVSHAETRGQRGWLELASRHSFLSSFTSNHSALMDVVLTWTGYSAKSIFPFLFIFSGPEFSPAPICSALSQVTDEVLYCSQYDGVESNGVFSLQTSL